MSDIEPKVKVLGYGSLMSPESLGATVPEAVNPVAAYALEVQRVFGLWDVEGWTVTNTDVGGVPFYAVTVVPSTEGSRVNGVVFDVNPDGFKALCAREYDYEPIITTAVDFVTDAVLGDCVIFSAPASNEHAFEFGEPAQQRYLEVCASGALEHGAEFYEEFLRTTYIGVLSLAEYPELFQPDGPLPLI